MLKFRQLIGNQQARAWVMVTVILLGLGCSSQKPAVKASATSGVGSEVEDEPVQVYRNPDTIAVQEDSAYTKARDLKEQERQNQTLKMQGQENQDLEKPDLEKPDLEKPAEAVEPAEPNEAGEE